MKAKKIYEVLEFTRDGDSFEKLKIGSHRMTSEIFHVSTQENKRFGLIYLFVEKNSDDPMVYKYSITKGNLSRKNDKMYNSQEMRSGSRAFHKDNPNKMAIPDDPALALRIAETTLSTYKPRKKGPIRF